MSTATYVYGIVKARKAPATGDAPAGVPGTVRVEALRVAPSIYLVASQVPAERYTGPTLEASLADLEQVAPIAMAHEAVVEFFARQPDLTVVPMKLFTLFSTPQRAVADVSARRKEIDAAIRRIAGSEEWGIRITRGDARPAAGPVTTVATSGKAFLSAKKQARDRIATSRAAAAGAASESFAALARLAKDTRVRQEPPPSGVTAPLLEAAFLVAQERRARFEAAARRQADRCAAAGAQLVLTGPWPAYSFVAGERTA